MTPTILVLAGLFNSGEGHWQTLWQDMLPNARRVPQKNWDMPTRTDWVAALDAAVRAADGTVILAAHSLGCATTAWWVAQHGQQPHAAKVRGALLVAPPDVEQLALPAMMQPITDFAPMPRVALPFPCVVAASSDDPWCAPARARSWAAAWGAQFHEIGARGHINAESGLGDWPQGRRWLAELESAAKRVN